MSKKLLVIVGPTASGKTKLSIKLAHFFGGEIISADSRQVYKGMDLGTGKVTKKEMKGIPHHLISIISPKTKFDVFKFKKLALKAIKDIQKRKKLPILVGGTGFYIKSITDNIILPKVKANYKLRKELENKSREDLFKTLEALDPRRAKSIDRLNKRRLIRAIEIITKTGLIIPLIKSEKPNFDILILGLKKDQNKLKELIEKRLLKRIKLGMIAEVKKLKETLSWKRLESFGLEYKYIALYLQNKITKDEMINKIQKESEHYAKRQMTWFKKDPEKNGTGNKINWINNLSEAKKLTKSFLK